MATGTALTWFNNKFDKVEMINNFVCINFSGDTQRQSPSSVSLDQSGAIHDLKDTTEVSNEHVEAMLKVTPRDLLSFLSFILPERFPSLE